MSWNNPGAADEERSALPAASPSAPAQLTDASFRTIVESSPVGTFLARADGSCTYANATFCQIAGRPSDQLLGHGWLDALHPDDRAGALELWAAAAAASTSARRQFRIVRPDGWTAVVLVNVAPVGDGSDTCVGTLEDVTERITFEKLARDSEARFRNLFESVADAIVVEGTDRKIRMVNRAAETMFGRSRTDMVGHSASVLYASQTTYSQVGRMIAVWDGEDVLLLETRFRAADGSEFPGEFRLCAFNDDDRATVGYIAVVRDITERQAAEEALRRSESFANAIFDYAPVGIEVFDSTGASIRLNDAQRALMRLCGPVPAANPSYLFEQGGPQVRELFRRALDGEAVEQAAVPVDPGDGSGARVLDLVLFPVGVGEGVHGVVSFTRDITERQQAEDRAARLAAIVESTHDAIIGIEFDGTITSWNGGAQRLYGYTAAEMIGESILRNVPESGLGEAREALERMRRGEPVPAFEARRIIKDGRQIDVNISVSPILDASGEAVGISVIQADITSRKQWEDALRESEERYRTTFESLHDVFYRTDAAGHFTMMSPSSRALLGFEPEELVGMHSRVLHLDAQLLEALVARIAMGGVVNDFEANLRRKDGTFVPVSLNAKLVFDASGAIAGVQGTARDITERKRAEEERDRIFRMSVDMIAVLDSDGRFLRVNPAWQRQLGYAEQQLLGLSAWSLVPPKDRPWAMERAAGSPRGDEVRDLTVRFRDRRGRYRWLSWTLAPITEDGLSYCVVRDVTESIKSQHQMQEMVDVLQANAAALSEQAAEMDRLRLEAEHLANHDMLTGAANRRAWFAHAARTRPTAIALFDVDFFKAVNDTYGHPAGDTVLRQVALRLEAALPEGALLGRLGGEEFGILLYNPFPEAHATAEAAATAIAASPIAIEGGVAINVTVSGGLAPWQAGADSREQSLARTYEDADHALYEAKATGRQRLVVHTPPRSAAA